MMRTSDSLLVNKGNDSGVVETFGMSDHPEVGYTGFVIMQIL